MHLIEATQENLKHGDTVLTRGYGKPEGERLTALVEKRGGKVLEVRQRTSEEIRLANIPGMRPVDPNEVMVICECSEGAGGGVGFCSAGGLWKVVG